MSIFKSILQPRFANVLCHQAYVFLFRIISQADQKILIVDDQSFNIEALKIILRYKLNIDQACCDIAYDGLEALQKVIEDADLQNKTSSY